ncbi:CPBP family intramembrane glutamic endopeptidase [Corynebacterium uterequi]|uniref:CPBP family intramembrane glutamic endopeptidase n=1 Tax=Corynebacterium uterequi TaxID=1072256 RepID=UPI0011875D8A
MKNEKSKFECLLVAIALVVIAGMLVNIGNATIVLAGFKNRLHMDLCLLIYAPLAFVAVPLLISRALGFKMMALNFGYKSAGALALLLGLLSWTLDCEQEIVHNLAIATCEELLFRWIILSVLISKFSKNRAIILGTLLFAFLLHLNGDPIANIAKVPAGLVLYYLNEKFGIQASIAFHCLHNLLVGEFLS